MTVKSIKDFTKKQKIIILIASIVGALVLCGIIIGIAAAINAKTPYTIDGVYRWSLSSSDEYSYYSEYTFDGTTVTRIYDYGTDIVTETFTYEIEQRADSRTITFHNVSTGEVEGPLTYLEETDTDGNILSIIINGVWYVRQ